MSQRLNRERRGSNAFERKPSESDLDFLLRVTSKTDQPDLFEQIQKQNLKILEQDKTLSKSDDVPFDEDEESISNYASPVGSPIKGNR